MRLVPFAAAFALALLALLLLNPDRVTREMLPPIFGSWDVIYSPPMVGTDRFDDAYWLKKDKEGGFPEDFYRAMADAGLG